MIKDTNIQRSIILPKDIVAKVQEIADADYISFNAVVKKILIEYFKNK